MKTEGNSSVNYFLLTFDSPALEKVVTLLKLLLFLIHILVFVNYIKKTNLPKTMYESSSDCTLHNLNSADRIEQLQNKL